MILPDAVIAESLIFIFSPKAKLVSDVSSVLALVFFFADPVSCAPADDCARNDEDVDVFVVDFVADGVDLEDFDDD